MDDPNGENKAEMTSNTLRVGVRQFYDDSTSALCSTSKCDHGVIKNQNLSDVI